MDTRRLANELLHQLQHHHADTVSKSLIEVLKKYNLVAMVPAICNSLNLATPLSKDADVKKLFALLEKFNLIESVPGIRNSINLAMRVNENSGVKITTAHAISKAALEKIINQYDLPKTINHVVKEELIGGYIIETNSIRIDASIQTQLNKLHHDLITSS